MNKTLSRYVIEASIVVGMLSIIIGFVQKISHMSSLYVPSFMGLSPTDFLNIGQVCFFLSVALAVRRILKHMEYALRPDPAAHKIGAAYLHHDAE